MATTKRGFTLFEVLIALVVLSLGAGAVFRVILASTAAVDTGRRWTAMAIAAASELARLERVYRNGAPRCAPPPAGSLLGPDGVGLSWTVAGDSVVATITMEARATSARRPLADTIVTGVVCQ